jgi:hypothetical protein
MRIAWQSLTILIAWAGISYAAPATNSDVRGALRAALCKNFLTPEFAGCTSRNFLGYADKRATIRAVGEIRAGGREFVVGSYAHHDQPEYRGDPDTLECNLVMLERVRGKLRYLGRYNIPCMTFRVDGNRVVFDPPAARFDDVDYFIIDEKGPPREMYVFGGFYTFYG